MPSSSGSFSASFEKGSGGRKLGDSQVNDVVIKPLLYIS